MRWPAASMFGHSAYWFQQFAPSLIGGTRSSWRTPPCLWGSGVADDDVDELAATGGDHLVRSTTRQDPGDLRAGQRESLQLGRRRVRGHDEAVAELAVDLDGNLA